VCVLVACGALARIGLCAAVSRPSAQDKVDRRTLRPTRGPWTCAKCQGQAGFLPKVTMAHHGMPTYPPGLRPERVLCVRVGRRHQVMSHAWWWLGILMVGNLDSSFDPSDSSSSMARSPPPSANSWKGWQLAASKPSHMDRHMGVCWSSLELEPCPGPCPRVAGHVDRGSSHGAAGARQSRPSGSWMSRRPRTGRLPPAP